MGGGSGIYEVECPRAVEGKVRCSVFERIHFCLSRSGFSWGLVFDREGIRGFHFHLLSGRPPEEDPDKRSSGSSAGRWSLFVARQSTHSPLGQETPLGEITVKMYV